MDTGGRDEQGFTLVEALVALVILSISLTAIFHEFGVGLLTATSAERDRKIVEAAANVFAELGTTRPIQEGWTEGSTVDGQRWRLQIDPVNIVDDHDLAPVATFVADLVVTSSSGDVKHRFQTLVLKPAS